MSEPKKFKKGDFTKYEVTDCKEKDSQGPTCKHPHL